MRPDPKHTSCKNCLFANYTADTQTGCKINMIDKFRRYECEIVEAFDDHKEFYVLPNRKCMWLRTNNWKWAKEDLYEQIAAIRQEIEMQYQAIIICGEDFAETKATVKSLTEQYLPPKHISLIRNPDNPITGQEMQEWILEHNKPFNIPWRVQNVTAADIPSSYAIDFVIDRCPHQYYFVCNSGCIVPKKVFSSLNQKIVDELYQLTVLSPNSQDDGLVISYALHKMLNGNQFTGILEKIKEQIDQPLPKVTDICPDFPK